MRQATALRIESDPATTDLVAARRREALAKQLRDSEPAEDLTDAYRVYDQLAALNDRISNAERSDMVNEAYILSLYDRARNANKRHDELADKVGSLEARTSLAFERADEVMDGHTVDIARLFEMRNAHSRQITDLAREQRALEAAVGERILLSQLDRDRFMRHEAEMAEFRQRLEAIEAVRMGQLQDKPLPREKDGLPLGAQIVLWTGALAAVGYAIYSFIA